MRAFATFTILTLLAVCGRIDPASPALAQTPANAPIAAAGPIATKEVYVTDSVPVPPGVPMAVIDSTSNRLLVAEAVATKVRWKASNPFAAIVYPAAGFLTVSLSTAEWAAIEQAESLSVRPASGGVR